MQDQTVIPGVQTMMLERLTLDPALQPRKDMDPGLMQDYSERLREGDIFPPLVAYLDDDAVCWLSQGWHRYGAARLAQFLTFEVEVRLGSRRDAMLDSLASNRDHGLRRSNADKQRAVIAMVYDPEWSQWTDRKIANHIGVSQPMVTKYRSGPSDKDYQMAADDDADAPPIKRLIERGGQQYEMDVSRINSTPRQPKLAEMLSRAGADDDPRIQQSRRTEAWAIFVSRWYDGVSTLKELDVMLDGCDQDEQSRIAAFLRHARGFLDRIEQALNARGEIRVLEGGRHG
jgi:hypothetical protein